MTTPASQAQAPQPWRVLRGPGTPAGLHAVLAEIAETHHLHLSYGWAGSALLGRDDGRAGQVAIRWQPYEPDGQRTQGHIQAPDPGLEVLIDPAPGSAAIAEQITRRLSRHLLAYCQAELDQITATMPLVNRYATPELGMDRWALIFRDHYVENSVGFLLGTRRAGVPAEWIYALSKGDRTLHRDRIHATLAAHGITSGILDNTAINDPRAHSAELERATASVDAFIDAAHNAGRRVLVIDDGGLLAQGYGRSSRGPRADAAIELTVSGLKRITAAGPPEIPVLNLARSQLKTHLGYPEIADSCLRRLRELLPARKIAGRPVLVIGYGTLGSRLTTALSAQGCQIHVTDTDPLTLILAAQAGYHTYRSVSEALRAVDPFLVIGVTGEDALTPADIADLPEGAFLAPFATRDFSLLTTLPHTLDMADIPGVGRACRLASGQTVVLLGDGRSLNLFEADAIPNQGYDAYRAGTLIAAGALCRQAGQIPAGVHTSLVDEIIRDSGLFEAYYDTYLQTRTPRPGRSGTLSMATAGAGATATPRACVVGYGVAGRLHAEVLSRTGADLVILDPKHQDLPKSYRSFRLGVAELPETIADGVELWSICCPTADHLPVLRSILARNPRARLLLEKPACQAHEIADLAALLQDHPDARVVITDQYRHAKALTSLTELITHFEPGQPAGRIGITFSKDRSSDIRRGRFVDRSYGVLGYEWLHMLAVLSQLLPAETMAGYLAGDPLETELWAVYDSQLFVSALTERSSLSVGATPVHIELASSITNPTVILTSAAPASDNSPGMWSRHQRPADDRHRHVSVHAGQTQFSAHLDPVTTAEGWQLARNRHRLTATRGGKLLHDEVIDDSPMHTAIQRAASALLSEHQLPLPDLGPLRRIAAMAEFLRARQPEAVKAAGST